MKKKSQSLLHLGWIGLFVGVLATPPLYAQTGADYAVGVSQKFGRGLLNVLSSPLEIPCTLRDEIQERGGAGTVTGLFRGLVFMARRLFVGSAEVGTFMIPMEATLPPVCAKKAEAQVT